MGFKTEIRGFFGFEKNLGRENPENIAKESAEIILTSPQEQILNERETTDKRQLGGGCNTTEFVSFLDDGSGVFKPKNGEKKLRESIEQGSYYKRERAAYLVDKFLNLELVPPTVIREIEGELGSVQQFIPDTEQVWTDKGKELIEKINDFQAQMMKMWIFDLLIFNSDRHGGNYLVDDKKVYAIDHGLTFGNDAIRPAKEYLDFELPQELIQKMTGFADNQEGRRILQLLLLELLSQEEVEALFIRLDRIASLLKESGKIPYSSLYDIYKFN